MRPAFVTDTVTALSPLNAALALMAACSAVVNSAPVTVASAPASVSWFAISISMKLLPLTLIASFDSLSEVMFVKVCEALPVPVRLIGVPAVALAPEVAN